MQLQYRLQQSDVHMQNKNDALLHVATAKDQGVLIHALWKYMETKSIILCNAYRL